MRAARIRLIVVAAVFAGWLGYLGYLALGQAKPIVVSRSQLLSATFVIKADVGINETVKGIGHVTVRESFGNQRIPEETILIENIGQARLPGGKTVYASGTGMYLLMLERTGAGKYRLVSAPGAASSDIQSPLLLVYPWNADVERQIGELLPKAE